MRHPLSACAAGLAIGICWGIYVLLLGLSATFFDYGKEVVTALAGLYWGYQATLLGSLCGTVWAFIDGFIAAFVAAWLYNKIALLLCKDKEQNG
jgi:hypothetical protein